MALEGRHDPLFELEDLPLESFDPLEDLRVSAQEPLVLLLLDHWPLRRGIGGHILEKTPLFAMAGVSSAITLLVQRPAMQVLEAVPFPERATNALVAYAVYIGKMLWPSRLAAIVASRSFRWPRATVLPTGSGFNEPPLTCAGAQKQFYSTYA